jgi:Fe2+ or Zn2+ uptake regulation protein
MVLASIFLEKLILLGGPLMGKKGHDLPKILRQELVLSIIEKFAGDNGILTSDIYEFLDNKCPGVNRRTLYRDLQDLTTRYPIYEDTIDGKTRWFLRNDFRTEAINSLFREYIQKELIEFFKKEKEEIKEKVLA